MTPPLARSRSSFALATLIVSLAASTPASADAEAPSLPPLPHGATAPGHTAAKLLGNVDYLLTRKLCASQETSVPAKLAQAASIVAQIPDAAEKASFQAYLDAAGAFWKIESEGPPGVITWTELASRRHALDERLRLLPQHKIDTPAAQDALFDEAKGILTQAAADHAIAAQIPATPCGLSVARDWTKATSPDEIGKSLRRALAPLLAPLSDPIAGAEQRMKHLTSQPAPRALLDVAASVDELRAIANEIPAARAGARAAVRWSEILDTPDDHSWADSEKRMDAVEAGVGPFLDKLLADVAMPAAVHDAGREATAKRAIVDKPLALRVTSTVRDEDHDVPVGAVVKYEGKTYLIAAAYRTTFKSFDVRWVSKKLPERWATLPGIAPGQLCSIKGGFVRKYSAGLHVKLGVWTLEEETDYAPMLCKNASATSELR